MLASKAGLLPADRQEEVLDTSDKKESPGLMGGQSTQMEKAGRKGAEAEPSGSLQIVACRPKTLPNENILI